MKPKSVLFSILYSYRKRILLTYSITFILIIPTLLPALFIGKGINIVTTTSNSESLHYFFISIVLTAIASLSSTLLNHLINSLKASITHKFQKEIFRCSINEGNYNWDSSNNLNTLLIDDSETIASFVIEDFKEIIINFIKIIVILFIITKINYKIMIFCSLQIFPVILIYYIISPKYKSIINKIRNNFSSIYKKISDYITFIPTLKAFSKNHFFFSNFKKTLKKYKKYNIKMNSIIVNQNYFTLFFIVYNFILIWIIGVQEVKNGAIKIGDLIALELFIGYLTNCILGIIFSIPKFGEFVFIKNKISKFMKKRNVIEKLNKIHFSDTIKIRNLSFNYETKQIFKNFNLQIPKNKLMFLLGKSGIGKTSLLKLITREETYFKGTIHIGKFVISDYNIQNYNKKVILVSEKSRLIGNTLKDILQISTDKSRDKAIEILKDLDFKFYADHLKNNKNMYIGLNGNDLSEGQKNRLLIAQALLQKPAFLIIDEALKSVDIHTEYKIIKTLIKHKKEMSIIIATHSLNFVELVDIVVLLDKKDNAISPIIHTFPNKEKIISLFDS